MGSSLYYPWKQFKTREAIRSLRLEMQIFALLDETRYLQASDPRDTVVLGARYPQQAAETVVWHHSRLFSR